MRDTDLPEFTLLLDSVCALLTRGTYTPNETSTVIFFNALAEFDMAAVRGAFEHHVKTNRFSPTPADIRDAIAAKAAADGRPGPEEAWTMAIGAADEAATVVWTAETAQAWGAARHVYAQGDEVGARMAFREVYGRLVAESRAAGEAVQWWVAEGHDPTRRAGAIRAALDRGIALQGQAADTLALPAPRDAVALLAAPQDLASVESAAKAAVMALQDIRSRITRQPDYVPGPQAVDIARTAGLRQQSAERVEAYAAGQGVQP